LTGLVGGVIFVGLKRRMPEVCWCCRYESLENTIENSECKSRHLLVRVIQDVPEKDEGAEAFISWNMQRRDVLRVVDEAAILDRSRRRGNLRRIKEKDRSQRPGTASGAPAADRCCRPAPKIRVIIGQVDIDEFQVLKCFIQYVRDR
jgi:hypothetical protein